MGRRRKGGYIGIVRPTERGRVRSRTDDRNVFWLRYRGARGGKKRRNPARARIYRVTLSELFQYRPKAELVLSSSFPSRSFIKSSRATADALVFFLASTQDYFFFFLKRRYITPGNMTLFRKLGKSGLFHSRNKRPGQTR